METPPGHEPATDNVSTPPQAGRNLPRAIVTGLLLAAVFLLSLWWHPLAVLGLIFGLVVVALLELDSAIGERGFRPATPVAIGAGAMAVFGTHFMGATAQTLSLALLMLGAAVWTFLGYARGRVVEVIGSTLLVGVWVPFCASFAALLLARPEGVWYVMATIAFAVSTDIGAYGFGSAWGRRKLAPRISPGKTWEGFGGGLATVIVLAVAVTAHLPGFGMVSALVLAVAVSLASTLGDLAESVVKRDLGVKDLGRILPGHGGIMDRVDSIIFALPAAHFALSAVGS
jgi:phosphatidate cytidylyltransferase